MRTQFVIPVLASILILGTLGLSQDAFAASGTITMINGDNMSGMVQDDVDPEMFPFLDPLFPLCISCGIGDPVTFDIEIIEGVETAVNLQPNTGGPVCTTIDFDALSPGTIVNNQFEDLVISCENNKSGSSDECTIFDSSNPTGGDTDLGTPNETFGGPGIGAGGELGEPGENNIALGHLIIIAEDIVDVSPPDGLVDDPDDERKGGEITFQFNTISTVESITLVDIDSDGGTVMTMTTPSGETITIPVPALGDNSVQTIPVDPDDVIVLNVETRDSMGIAEITYCLGTEPIPEPGPTVTCGPGITLNGNECEADVTQGDLDTLQTIIDGLQSEIQNLLNILLSK